MFAAFIVTNITVKILETFGNFLMLPCRKMFGPYAIFRAFIVTLFTIKILDIFGNFFVSHCQHIYPKEKFPEF
jgi:hypothetical protein